MGVKTRYDRNKKAAIMLPIEVPINEKEYRIFQRLSLNQFGYFYIRNYIKTKDNSISEVYLSGMEVNTNDMEDLGELKNLEVLNLEYNYIKRLSEALMNLKKLKQLHLSYNSLTSLPKSINKLKSLEELYLLKNPIVSVPESILKTESLEHLVIDRKDLDQKSKMIIEKLRKRKPKVTVIW